MTQKVDAENFQVVWKTLFLFSSPAVLEKQDLPHPPAPTLKATKRYGFYVYFVQFMQKNTVVSLLRRPASTDGTEPSRRRSVRARLRVRVKVHVEDFLLLVDALANAVAAQRAIHARSRSC